MFWQKGQFEVFKKSSEIPGNSSIDVRVPPELEGSAYIQVSIHMTTRESVPLSIHMTPRISAPLHTYDDT